MQIKNIERTSKSKHNKQAPRRKRMNCFRCSIIYDRIYHFSYYFLYHTRHIRTEKGFRTDALGTNAIIRVPGIINLKTCYDKSDKEYNFNCRRYSWK